MGFRAAVRSGFAQYVTWRGRASRSEYWYFYLCFAMAYIAAGVIGIAIAVTAPAPALLLVPVIPVVLVFVLPQLAVTIRRLHDIDRSGWWFWLAYVPLIGAVTLLIFCCTPGTPGPNRFGPPPHGLPAS